LFACKKKYLLEVLQGNFFKKKKNNAEAQLEQGELAQTI